MTVILMNSFKEVSSRGRCQKRKGRTTYVGKPLCVITRPFFANMQTDLLSQTADWRDVKSTSVVGKINH